MRMMEKIVFYNQPVNQHTDTTAIGYSVMPQQMSVVNNTVNGLKSNYNSTTDKSLTPYGLQSYGMQQCQDGVAVDKDIMLSRLQYAQNYARDTNLLDSSVNGMQDLQQYAMTNYIYMPTFISMQNGTSSQWKNSSESENCFQEGCYFNYKKVAKTLKKANKLCQNYNSEGNIISPNQETKKGSNFQESNKSVVPVIVDVQSLAPDPQTTAPSSVTKPVGNSRVGTCDLSESIFDTDFQKHNNQRQTAMFDSMQQSVWSTGSNNTSAPLHSSVNNDFVNEFISNGPVGHQNGTVQYTKGHSTYFPRTPSYPVTSSLAVCCEPDNSKINQAPGVYSRSLHADDFALKNAKREQKYADCNLAKYSGTFDNVSYREQVHRSENEKIVKYQTYANVPYIELVKRGPDENTGKYSNSPTSTRVLHRGEMSVVNEEHRAKYPIKQTSHNLSLKDLVQRTPDEIRAQYSIMQNSSNVPHSQQVKRSPEEICEKNNHTSGNVLYRKPMKRWSADGIYSNNETSDNVHLRGQIQKYDHRKQTSLFRNQRSTDATYPIKQTYADVLKCEPVKSYTDKNYVKHTNKQTCSNLSYSRLVESKVPQKKLVLNHSSGEYAKFTLKPTFPNSTEPIQRPADENNGKFKLVQRFMDEYCLKYPRKRTSNVPHREPMQMPVDKSFANYQSKNTSPIVQHNLKYPSKQTHPLQVSPDQQILPNVQHKNPDQRSREPMQIPVDKSCANYQSKNTSPIVQHNLKYPSKQTHPLQVSPDQHILPNVPHKNPDQQSREPMQIPVDKSCANYQSKNTSPIVQHNLKYPSKQTHSLQVSPDQQIWPNTTVPHTNPDQLSAVEQTTYSVKRTLDDLPTNTKLAEKRNSFEIVMGYDSQAHKTMVCSTPTPLEECIGNIIVRCDNAQNPPNLELANSKAKTKESVVNYSPNKNSINVLQDLNMKVKKERAIYDSAVTAQNAINGNSTNGHSELETTVSSKPKDIVDRTQYLNDRDTKRYVVPNPQHNKALGDCTTLNQMLKKYKHRIKTETSDCPPADFSIMNIMTCKERKSSRPVLFYKKGESVASLMHNMSVTNMSADIRELFEENEVQSDGKEIFAPNLKVIAEKLPPDFDYQVKLSENNVQRNGHRYKKDIKVIAGQLPPDIHYQVKLAENNIQSNGDRSKEDFKLNGKKLPEYHGDSRQDRLKQVGKRVRDDQESSCYPRDAISKKQKCEERVDIISSTIPDTSTPDVQSNMCNINIKVPVIENRIKKQLQKAFWLKEAPEKLKYAGTHNYHVNHKTVSDAVMHNINDKNRKTSVLDNVAKQNQMQYLYKDLPHAIHNSEQSATMQQLRTNNNYMEKTLIATNTVPETTTCVHPFKDLIRKYNSEESKHKESISNMHPQAKKCVEVASEESSKFKSSVGDAPISRTDTHCMIAQMPVRRRNSQVEVPIQRLVKLAFHGVEIPCITRYDNAFLPLNYIHRRFFRKKPLTKFRHVIKEIHINKREMSVAEQKMLEPILRKYNIKSSKLIMFDEFVHNFYKLCRNMDS